MGVIDSDMVEERLNRVRSLRRNIDKSFVGVGMDGIVMLLQLFVRGSLLNPKPETDEREGVTK